MENIESETKFVLKLAKDILLLPITLILVLARKKQVSELFNPLKDFFRFITEAKFIFFIIIVNVIVYIIEFILFYTGQINEAAILPYIWKPSYLLQMNFLPLLTAQFLHNGFMHLFWNMIFLFALGRVVEKKLGIIKTAIIYFASGFISLITYSLVMLYIIGADLPGLGASAAIAGIMAAALLLSPLYITFIAIIPMPVLFVVIIKIYSDITGFLSFSDNFGGNIAHLGGYASILFSQYLLSRQDREEMKKGFWISIAVLIAVVIVYFLLLRYNVISLIKI